MNNKNHEYVIRFVQETPMGLSSTHEYMCNIYSNTEYNAGRKFKSMYKSYFKNSSAYRILEWQIICIDGKVTKSDIHYTGF